MFGIRHELLSLARSQTFGLIIDSSPRAVPQLRARDAHRSLAACLHSAHSRPRRSQREGLDLVCLNPLWLSGGGRGERGGICGESPSRPRCALRELLNQKSHAYSRDTLLIFPSCFSFSCRNIFGKVPPRPYGRGSVECSPNSRVIADQRPPTEPRPLGRGRLFVMYPGQPAVVYSRKHPLVSSQSSMGFAPPSSEMHREDCWGLRSPG